MISKLLTRADMQNLDKELSREGFACVFHNTITDMVFKFESFEEKDVWLEWNGYMQINVKVYDRYGMKQIGTINW